MRECGWSSSDSDPGRFSLRLQKSAGRGRIGVPRAGIARPRTFQCRSLCPARSPLIPPSRIEWRFLSCLDGRGVGWSVSSATELGSIWMVSKGVVPSYGDRRFESPSLTAASHVAAALEPVPHEQGKRGADASARQLLVAGLASQDDRDDAEQGKAGHDRRGVGQAAELDDQQAGPFHVIGVTRHRFSRSIQKPGRASRRLHAGCRSGRLQGIPRADPGGRVTPRF